MYLKDYVAQFPNFLPLKTCSTLIRFAHTRLFEEARVGSGEGIINKKIREVNRYPLSAVNKSLSDVHWTRLLEFKIKHFIQEYIQNKNLIGLLNYDLSINQMELLKYEKNNHYKFHVDHFKDLSRTLSIVIILNNDYEGGELVFKNTMNDEEVKIRPIAGSVVIFPSNFLYPHTVKPVTEGTRYSIVAWAC